MATLLLSGCALSWAQDTMATGQKPAAPNYNELLQQFPLGAQGYGAEPTFSGLSHQPMTYGLLLSAEAIHYAADSNPESEARVREAVEWLIANGDLDEDGAIGWGLPDAWDAFQDDSSNPEHQPYTITTAIVLDGLLDALEYCSFWSDSERARIEQTLYRATLRWATEAWTADSNGAYFWYSTNENDNHPVINASAMLTGVLQRLLARHPNLFSRDQASLVQNAVDQSAAYIVELAHLSSEGPHWNYVAVPNDLDRTSMNDIVHHLYTLWGMNTYDHYGGTVALTWSPEQAQNSIDTFVREEQIYRFAAPSTHPARLWGAGMLIAYEARWGSPSRADQFIEILFRDYGEPSDLSWYPQRQEIVDPEVNSVFYPRFAAHVLYGLAYSYYHPHVR